MFKTYSKSNELILLHRYFDKNIFEFLYSKNSKLLHGSVHRANAVTQSSRRLAAVVVPVVVGESECGIFLSSTRVNCEMVC